MNSGYRYQFDPVGEWGRTTVWGAGWDVMIEPYRMAVMGYVSWAPDLTFSAIARAA